MQITKSQKYFHKQTLILNQVIVFLFYFLKSNINQFNFVMSSFSLILKSTNKFSFATWLFILKPFSKTNKKHTTNQTEISTPNYEVLIPHGYVGKGPSPSESIKNVDK